MDWESKWKIALFGWLAYNLLIFFIQKEKADRKGKPFNYKKFTSTHWDNWIVTAVFAWPIVEFGPDIHLVIMAYTEKFFNFSMEWNKLFYAGPGPLVEFLYFLLSKYSKISGGSDKEDS